MSSRSRTVETSLIATLDILGVSGMMKAAQKEALPKLAQSLEKAFQEAKAGMAHYIDAIDTTSQPGLKMARFIKTRVFSDTIVVSCDFNRIMHEVPLFSRLDCPEYQRMVLGFFICVKSLALSLFRDGYPTRGCIASGQIIATKDFIIGKPFVESLEIAKELNFAGVVLTDCAKLMYEAFAPRLNEFARQAPVETHLLYDKSNKRRRYYCLNVLDFHDDKYLVTNMVSSFFAHGKVFSSDVQEKITNTQRLFESFLKTVRRNEIDSRSAPFST